MTNEELFEDLKQYLDATLSQNLANVATKDDLENMATKDDIVATKDDINALREEMDERFDEVLNAVGGSIANLEAKHNDHDKRIVRLETRQA